jgi:hypothetical protein
VRENLTKMWLFGQRRCGLEHVVAVQIRQI